MITEETMNVWQDAVEGREAVLSKVEIALQQPGWEKEIVVYADDKEAMKFLLGGLVKLARRGLALKKEVDVVLDSRWKYTWETRMEMLENAATNYEEGNY